jgi:EAL domain-containing protein (putative c-di-GMP-specific phosphodiesterase class I)
MSAPIPALFHLEKAPGLPRVLLVDDDEHLRRALVRSLASSFQITSVPGGEAAIAAVRQGSFDAVLCDVHMAGMSGLELLRKLRETDLDLPVILMTGAPSLESAVPAVELGALRYLVKPVPIEELRKALTTAVGMRRLSEARRQSLEALGQSAQAAGDRAGLETVVDGAIGTLRVAWQPIVSWPRRRVMGYEALMRSRLPNPEALIEAAERSGRVITLGRAMRAATAASGLVAPSADLYVNLHPHDLLDDSLFDPQAPLSKLAARVVLEVTERVSLESIPELASRLARLRKLGYRLALDDLGAGYAGLASFAALEPEVVKIDISLVRDVHRSTTRRRLIASILSACRDLKCTAIAEGVELPAERDALSDLGCELFQGFLFARPGFAFPDPQW